MASLSAAVVTFEGEVLSLPSDLGRAKTALLKDGGVVLKNVTWIREEALQNHPDSRSGLLNILHDLSCIEYQIICNWAVRLLLGDDYYITSCRSFVHYAKTPLLTYGYDENAPPPQENLVSVMAVHLGGGVDLQWAIHVSEDSHTDKPTGQSIIVPANGGDVFLCNGMLERTNARLERLTPESAYSMSVSYWRHNVKWPDDVFEVGINEGILNKLLEVGGSDVYRTRNGKGVILRTL